jgi:hypothetical protein
MDTKIKEFIEQAHTYSFQENRGQFVLNDFAENFAELIVRECIERVGRQYTPIRDSTIEGRPNPFFPELRVRTECEQGIVEYGIKSVMALEELIQEQTDKWYKENVLGDEE